MVATTTIMMTFTMVNMQRCRCLCGEFWNDARYGVLSVFAGIPRWQERGRRKKEEYEYDAEEEGDEDENAEEDDEEDGEADAKVLMMIVMVVMMMVMTMMMMAMAIVKILEMNNLAPFIVYVLLFVSCY